MMQDWAERFYSSKQWKKCREAYKKIVHYQCEMCGGAGEIVHHKTPLTPENINDPEVSLSFRQLRLLCRKCHGATHGHAVTVEGVAFDADGNLVRSPPTLSKMIKGYGTAGDTSKEHTGRARNPPSPKMKGGEAHGS